MSAFKTSTFLSDNLDRFHSALVTKFEAETGLSKNPDEPHTAYGARVQRAIGWPRFKELTEQVVNDLTNFKLPPA